MAKELEKDEEEIELQEQLNSSSSKSTAAKREWSWNKRVQVTFVTIFAVGNLLYYLFCVIFFAQNPKLEYYFET